MAKVSKASLKVTLFPVPATIQDRLFSSMTAKAHCWHLCHGGITRNGKTRASEANGAYDRLHFSRRREGIGDVARSRSIYHPFTLKVAFLPGIGHENSGDERNDHHCGHVPEEPTLVTD